MDSTQSTPLKRKKIPEHEKLKPQRIKRENKTSRTPEEAPWSSAASLIRYATGWAGDDLEELIRLVHDTRGSARL